MDGIRKGLGQLRSSFSPQDSQQQVIDVLEHGISEMMTQLMDRSGSPSGKRSRRHVSTCLGSTCVMYMYEACTSGIEREVHVYTYQTSLKRWKEQKSHGLIVQCSYVFHSFLVVLRGGS